MISRPCHEAPHHNLQSILELQRTCDVFQRVVFRLDLKVRCRGWAVDASEVMTSSMSGISSQRWMHVRIEWGPCLDSIHQQSNTTHPPLRVHSATLSLGCSNVADKQWHMDRR